VPIPHRAARLSLVLALTAPLSAQSIGGSGGLPSGAGLTPGSARPGAEVPKPGGGTFFVDGHRNGHAAELFLEEIRSGRLVEVHGLDAGGAIDPAPRFRDVLVGETIQSDGADYLLYTSPATQVEHLVVLREPGAPEPSPGAGTFNDLLRAAEQAAALVPVRDPLAPQVPTLPRNGALSLRFSDLLTDDAAAQLALASDVQVRVGSPASLPFAARILFDPNHGGLAQGSFHATRVLLDATVSSFESSELVVPLPVNALGLPPGPTPQANVVLRLPSRRSPGTGQFTRLENLAGHGLATSGNGPVDLGSPTDDVVRGARAANELEPNGGFLLDLEAPRALGGFGVAITQAVADPGGTPGHAFLVDWTFQGPCSGMPLRGDALEVAGLTLEVVEAGPVPDAMGAVQGVRVRLAQRAPTSAGALLGAGSLVARVRPGLEDSACWFGIVPAPLSLPGDGVSTSAQFQVRFSEPMRATSLDPYDNVRLVQGPSGVAADALNTVVAQLLASADLSLFQLSPLLPLAHTLGEATAYHLEVLGGSDAPTDLAGNALVAPPTAEIHVAKTEATRTSGGIVLRFSDIDEVPGTGRDLRGNFFYDLAAGTVRGRPASFTSYVADRVNPVPSIMIPLPSGVQTPLSPLGSKLHSVWRYCDLGWNVRDETKYDLDVTGLSWAPAGGLVVADFFPEFEIRLAHASRLPDEAIDQNLLPRYSGSGLVAGPAPYTDNVLQDPLSPQKVVHPRNQGYTVSAADLFSASSGTVMLPYPLNRGGGPLETYTWRDTSVLAEGGPGGAGVPLDIEVGPPLFLDVGVGSLAAVEHVPSIGLPLLMEYRCFPTDLGLGLNSLDVSLAINSSAQPHFRSFSTGGIDSSGQVVAKDPDLETSPTGGFNPLSNPPGQPTLSAETVFYIGQVDVAVRLSRIHSAWFDTQSPSPDFAGVLASVLPLAAGSAAGVQVEVRGASGFTGTGGVEVDASQLDAYGDVPSGTVDFWNGDATWQADPDAIDGARYLPVRLTLANDLESLESPHLDSLAIAFER